MTDKMQRAYSALKLKHKIGIILALIVISFTSSMLIAYAASGISFSGQTPAAGSTIGTPKPTITVNTYDTEGTLLTSDYVRMKIGNQEVAPAVYQLASDYQISYTPIEKMADGNYTITVDVYNVVQQVYDSSSWSFTIDAAPNPSGWSPAKNSIITATNPKISLNVKDAFDELDPNSLQVTLDGSAVTPNFEFKGHDETYTYGDSCTSWSETVRIIDSYKEGIISFNASGLTSGTHTVQISMADKAGNVLIETWTFNRAVSAPTVVSLSPADGGSTATDSPAISAKVRDAYYDLNSASASLKLDGVTVPTGFKYQGRENFDTCSGDYLGYLITSRKEGTFTYQAANLADGSHKVELSIANVNGDVLIKQWSFTVGVKPVFSGFTPVNSFEAKAVTGVSVKVSDDNLNPTTIVLKDNNTTIPHTYDASTGNITYNGNFAYGKHTLQVSAADADGNLGTATWYFISDDRAPNFSTVNPQVGLVNNTNGIFDFNAVLVDLVDITPDTVLKLDEQVVPANISYEMNIDTCSGETLGIKSKKKVTVNYKAVIPDGNHTLTLSTGDILGNTTTDTWTINVASKPLITQWKPVTYISNLKPVISANIKDGNDTISLAAIAMTLDGQTVTPNYDPASGNLSYTPDQLLSNEAYHTVTLSTYDPGGLANAITWKFNINTYPDMLDSNMQNCSACHEIDESAAIPFQAIHNTVSFYGSHSDNRCDACHNYITYPADCYQCHGPEEGESDAPHGSSPGINYKLKNFDPYYPVRITVNREMWDCVICHQPGSPVLGWYWARVQPTKVLNNHDIPELHKAAESSCNKCHAKSLTREHSRDGRVDQAGIPITCNTCHKSQDAKVISAITNKDKNCTSCHLNADHESLHTSGLDSKCQNCHNKGITTEHLNNTTTAGKDYNCDTCHNGQDKEVKRTIAANSLNCAGCHSTGHNIKFADTIPLDIPLYTGYEWTDPLEAAIFAGENTTPAGYDNGQVILSNRRNDVTAMQVWDFYNQQLVAKGWILKSGAPETNTVFFSAEFEKEGRCTTIKYFNTALNDGNGPVSSGYRIEVWYK